ncbi:hypothetical protein PHAVU_010G002900 [Phaseolus vulgaris]|uniref:CBM20 domain-containing protein n=1 Tax=Phaseolus vulgaris TaxID=3885 RepID=V7AK42_PHAVU|nr:hypothetical protein PHAVU_010G002900g [Phaseolus vulgaris]ESW05909.1 hypothetical protein PHAVU_010G002900g [Phaseolus vulgaris]
MMKSLTSSCSESILHSLGSFSPRVAIRVSDRPEFFFSPRSRNGNKGCNACLLKLVPVKAIFPVHAVPSKDQVDSENAEPEAEKTEQTNESKFVHVTFKFQKNCDFGEQFLLVGGDPMFGSWNPLEALPMTWSEGDVWSVEMDIPVGNSIQYKFILKGKEGDNFWQPGPDRFIHICETMERITVSEDWENADLQKISEDAPLAEPDKEPQIDSEVDSNASEIKAVKATQSQETPFAEPVTNNSSSSWNGPLVIVAENIISSEDVIRHIRRKWNEKKIRQGSEESANSTVHDLGNNGSAESLKNQESSLLDFQNGLVLVPGLMQPPTEPTNEASQGEVEEKTSMDISVEASESDEDQNPPELSMEQETDVPELDEHDLSPDTDTDREERPKYEADDGTPLQNHIKWGKERVKKFLAELGFLGGSKMDGDS